MGKCRSCGCSYTTSNYLKQHIATIHEGKREFSCGVCNSNFTNKTNLRNHVAVVHKGKKPFKCKNCQATFGYKHVLRKHMDIHTDEKESSIKRSKAAMKNW